jgi:integrase
MSKAQLKLVTPSVVKRTVIPTRSPNADLRTREYLTEAEVEQLMTATRKNRWGHRDATMILVAYRHGLRVSELVDLRWDQVDFRTAALHVRRVKQGTPSTHPILGDELRALRRLQRCLSMCGCALKPRLGPCVVPPIRQRVAASGEQEPKSPFVFTSERGSPFTTAGFARMVERSGAEARCRLTSATETSSTRCAIPNCRQDVSRIFGATDANKCPLLGAKRSSILRTRISLNDPKRTSAGFKNEID